MRNVILMGNLKLLLGILPEDASQDRKLRLLLSTAAARLKLLLGGLEPPESMDHILMEVAIARFNRIGSEGLDSHTVEGESLSFCEDDFAPFAGEIQAWVDTQKAGARGRLRFL